MFLTEDINKYKEEVKVTGILYVIGFIGVLFISILKEIETIKFNRKIKSVYSGFNTVSCTPEQSTYADFTKGIEKSNMQFGLERFEKQEDIFNKERKKIYEYSRFIGNKLLETNYMLEGIIVKQKTPRISMEQLLREIHGAEPSKFIIQHITFGNDLNEAISYLFGITKKKERGSSNTYLVFENGSFYELEEKMKYYFMDRGLKIKIIDNTKIKM